MSIYDATEFLLHKLDGELDVDTYELLLAFIDDDDSLQAERIRSILQVRLERAEVQDDFIDEDTSDDPEYDAETDAQWWDEARGILLGFSDEIDEDCSLEGIKKVVFREEAGFNHEEKLQIAHLVYEMYFND